MKNKGKSILGVVSDILLIIIIIIAIVITVMTFTSKSSDLGVGNILGYTPFAVQTDSMAPTFSKGDLIIGKNVEDITTLKVGDVITYSAVLTDSEGNLEDERSFNTHRIYEIEYDKSGKVEAFVTKGDAMNTEDNTYVYPDEVIAKQVNSGINSDGSQKTGLRIAKIGAVLKFLQSRNGFMICIIVPLALFFIWQIYKLIAMFMESKAANISEETKKQAIEEYLAKQEREKKEENGSKDSNEK